MNSQLRNKIAAAITSGGGAIAIATAMLGGHDGLEGRRYVAYRDVVGVLTVCDGHTGADIILGKRYSEAECDALLKSDLQKVARIVYPAIKVKTTETQRRYLLVFVQRRPVCVYRLHDAEKIERRRPGRRVR